MPTLNLGIVAHVDAGKTSLTERLLYEAGALDALGSVDAGTTSTDSMDLERRRGITIRAAVASLRVGDVDLTLVDTPGHPDFVAEVERSLTVLDAAVLVLSSVEGVQPQSVAIWRALRRTGVPTVVFVNKVDRRGSDVDRVVEQVRRRLTGRVVVLADADGQGSRDARTTARSLTDPRVVEAVAEVDERLLARWAVGERRVAEREVDAALRRAVAARTLTPVLCGSAITGTGLVELRQVLTRLLPRAPEDHYGEAAATVFAVDRDARGRRAWLRTWTGRLAVRDRVAVDGREPERVTEVAVSRPGGLEVEPSVGAGRIAIVRGLAGVQVGDHLGTPPERARARWAPATLQSLVEPVDPVQRAALWAGLAELADEDPLVDLRIEEADGEAAVSLHGEVQQEIVAALLEERYGVRVRFAPLSVVCIERVVGTGEAVERIGVDANPYLATLGLRVERADVGSGLVFSPGVERGNLPASFVAATEEGVRSALRQGLRGWSVTDAVVTMTASGYYPRQSRMHQKFDKAMSSVGADFRLLAEVVVTAALRRARTRVCRPVDHVDLDLPDHALGTVTALLGPQGGVVLASTSSGPGSTRLEVELPSGSVPALVRRLPDLTGGEGVLESAFDHHAPAPVGPAMPLPTRPRRGPDPGDRRAWFRAMPR